MRMPRHNPSAAACGAALACLMTGARADQASPASATALQRQLQSLSALVARQQDEIADLRGQLLQLQMAQRGRGYTPSLVGAQALEGAAIAGLPTPLGLDGGGDRRRWAIADAGSAGANGTTSGAAAQGAGATGASDGTAQPAPSTLTTPDLGSSQQQSAGDVQQSHEEVAAQGHAPLFTHKFTLTPGWTSTYYDRRQISLTGFLALDAIFLGNISVNQTKASIQTFDLAGQYGATGDLSLNFDIPYVLRSSTFLAAGEGTASSSLGQATVSNADLGDVNFGVDYRMVREHDGVPDVVGSLKITAPTGTSPFGIGIRQPDANNTNLQVPDRLPTGNGIWSINPSISVLKSNDPVVLFGNLGFIYNVPRSVAVIDPVTFNAPGRIKLGPGLQIGGGFALVLNDRTSISTSVLTQISSATKIEVAGRGWQTVPGSASTNTSLAFGLNYAISPRLTMSASLQAGLTPDAPNYALSLRFPYTF